MRLLEPIADKTCSTPLAPYNQDKDNTWVIESFYSLDAGDDKRHGALTPTLTWNRFDCKAQAANYTFDLLSFNCPALIMGPLSQGSCVSRQIVSHCTRITLAEVCVEVNGSPFFPGPIRESFCSN